MTKELIPINIKTSSFGPLVYRTKDNVIHFYQYYGIMESMGDEHHNIYFLSKERIKVDDYAYDDTEVGKVMSIEYIGDRERAILRFVDFADETLDRTLKDCFKVVATTNPKLIKDGVPAIPEEYVRHYAYKNGDIDKVEIETESFYVEPPEGMHSNRGHFIDIPKLQDNDIGQKEVVIYHEPAPVIDWNKFTMQQFIEHLEEEFMFSSTGTAKSVFELIRAYKDMREGLEWIKKEYVDNVNEQDAITEKLDKLLEGKK